MHGRFDIYVIISSHLHPVEILEVLVVLHGQDQACALMLTWVDVDVDVGMRGWRRQDKEGAISNYTD